MNPYWGQDFWGFFGVLFRRMAGQLPQDHLASDEVQIIVLLGITLSTVLLGTLLTLKKMSMMANALSHTTLVGIVISFLLFAKGPELGLNGSTLFLSATIAAVLTTLLIEWVRNTLNLQEDAAIGLVFTTLFALGIILVTVFTRNSHIGVEVITGNADALHPEDITLAWVTALIDCLAIVLFFRPWIMTAFDERLSFSMGVPIKKFHYLLMFLTALTMVSAFRAVGVLLVLAFLVGPPLTARLWTFRLTSLIGLALGFGMTASILGVALSRHLLSVHHLPLSTGGIVVSVISLQYLLSTLLTLRSFRGLMRRPEL